MAETHFEVAGMTLSALEKRPTGPVRGIVLALHGGGYRAGYWDFQASSLLDIAAARGCLAVAIDRPGYGAARAFPMPLAQQASVVLQLAADLRAREGGAPLLLAGHSMGGILALIAGADPRATAILAAIDACGVPLRYQPAMQEALLVCHPAKATFRRSMPNMDERPFSQPMEASIPPRSIMPPRFPPPSPVRKCPMQPTPRRFCPR